MDVRQTERASGTSLLPGLIAAAVMIVIAISLIATSTPGGDPQPARDSPLDAALTQLDGAESIGSLGAFRDACQQLTVAVGQERTTGGTDGSSLDDLAAAAHECVDAIDAGDVARLASAGAHLDEARRSLPTG